MLVFFVILFSCSLFPLRKLLEMEVPESRYLASCKAIEETSEAMKACGEFGNFHFSDSSWY